MTVPEGVSAITEYLFKIFVQNPVDPVEIRLRELLVSRVSKGLEQAKE
ncbi:MAG TPA: hypothetical protein V6C84_20270 [Coleofasciculaceae cyanobacterium]|jgi:hypothetical protein